MGLYTEGMVKVHLRVTRPLYPQYNVGTSLEVYSLQSKRQCLRSGGRGMMIPHQAQLWAHGDKVEALVPNAEGPRHFLYLASKMFRVRHMWSM